MLLQLFRLKNMFNMLDTCSREDVEVPYHAVGGC